MIQLFTVALIAGLVFESHSQPALTGLSSLGLKPPPFLPVKPYWPYYPTHIQCWTEWFDRDDPSGTGDWEVLYNLRKENPGKICPKPQGIQVETTSGLSVAAAGEVIYKSDTTTGFVCRNQDQPDKKCNDYRVRFSCHPPFCGGGVCWTDWFDRDNPSGTGDWETLASLKTQYPGKICETPLYIEAVTTDTMTPAILTGEAFLYYNPTQGFVCRNKDQSDYYCRDYKVRFGCACDCFPEKKGEEKIMKIEKDEKEDMEKEE